MLTRLGVAATALATRDPFTDVVGLARTLLALATAGTLLATDPAALFHPTADGGAGPRCGGPANLALHCLVGPGQLELARWLSVVGLLVVASGWRPRVTAVPHWWLTWSLSVTATLTDGGDQVAASLALLLVPIALADRRRWHWTVAPSDTAPPDAATSQRRVLGWSVGWVIRLQVAGVYLHAAVAKLGQPEWADGTALYYWLGNPTFGLPGWLAWAGDPVLRSGVGVTAVTWGVIVLEVLLVTGLVATPAWRRGLLVGGLVLHVGIATMGLASFAVVMAAALVLYLRPLDEPVGVAARVSRARLAGPRRPAATRAAA